MKAEFKLEDTDSVEATLSLRMTLGRWKKPLEQLPSDYPAWEFASALRKMIREAEQHFSSEHKDE